MVCSLPDQTECDKAAATRVGEVSSELVWRLATHSDKEEKIDGKNNAAL